MLGGFSRILDLQTYRGAVRCGTGRAPEGHPWHGYGLQVC